MKLAKTYEAFKGSEENDTVFTEKEEGEITMKQSRPGLLVSSTSWTEDEDFYTLFRALAGITKIINSFIKIENGKKFWQSCVLKLYKLFIRHCVLNLDNMF